MIVTVTANPILDRTLRLKRLVLDDLNRADLVRREFAGKGVNVSRALAALGIPSRVVGFVGGATGHAYQQALIEEGFAVDFVEIAGETRQSVLIHDDATRQSTKINEHGPTLHPAEADALVSKAAATAQPGDIWVLAGSLPPGAPDDLYARLIETIQAKGARAMLDSSKAALKQGITGRPFAVKPNSEEAADYFDQPLVTTEDHLDAVRRLIDDDGIELAVVTRGGDGLVLASSEADQVVIATPPPVTVVSTIAAGDCTLAGLLWGLVDGCDTVELARRAVACGTAAVMQEGSGVGDRATVESLLGRVTIQI